MFPASPISNYSKERQKLKSSFDDEANAKINHDEKKNKSQSVKYLSSNPSSTSSTSISSSPSSLNPTSENFFQEEKTGITSKNIKESKRNDASSEKRMLTKRKHHRNSSTHVTVDIAFLSSKKTSSSTNNTMKATAYYTRKNDRNHNVNYTSEGTTSSSYLADTKHNAQRLQAIPPAISYSPQNLNLYKYTSQSNSAPYPRKNDFFHKEGSNHDIPDKRIRNYSTDDPNKSWCYPDPHHNQYQNSKTSLPNPKYISGADENKLGFSSSRSSAFSNLYPAATFGNNDVLHSSKGNSKEEKFFVNSTVGAPKEYVTPNKFSPLRSNLSASKTNQHCVSGIEGRSGLHHEKAITEKSKTWDSCRIAFFRDRKQLERLYPQSLMNTCVDRKREREPCEKSSYKIPLTKRHHQVHNEILTGEIKEGKSPRKSYYSSSSPSTQQQTVQYRHQSRPTNQRQQNWQPSPTSLESTQKVHNDNHIPPLILSGSSHEDSYQRNTKMLNEREYYINFGLQTLNSSFNVQTKKSGVVFQPALVFKPLNTNADPSNFDQDKRIVRTERNNMVSSVSPTQTALAYKKRNDRQHDVSSLLNSPFLSFDEYVEARTPEKRNVFSSDDNCLKISPASDVDLNQQQQYDRARQLMAFSYPCDVVSTPKSQYSHRRLGIHQEEIDSLEKMAQVNVTSKASEMLSSCTFASDEYSIQGNDGNNLARLQEPFSHSKTSTLLASPLRCGSSEGRSIFSNAGNKQTTINPSATCTGKRFRRKCAVPECTNRVVQGGVCISHGAKRKTCCHPGCQKHVKKAGKCSAHGPPRKKCEFHECTKIAVQGGKCIAHGARTRLHTTKSSYKQAHKRGIYDNHNDEQDGQLFSSPGNMSLPTVCVVAHDKKSSSKISPSMSSGYVATTSSPHQRKHQDQESTPSKKCALSIFHDLNAMDSFVREDEKHFVTPMAADSMNTHSRSRVGDDDEEHENTEETSRGTNPATERDLQSCNGQYDVLDVSLFTKEECGFDSAEVRNIAKV